eukprot:5259249-Amphidinium_carterae.3
MTSTIGSLLGVPTTTRLTIGMISINNTEQQPAPATEARASRRLTQAQQLRRRRNATETPPRTRRQELLAQQSEQQLEVHEHTIAVVLESDNDLAPTVQLLLLDNQYPSDSNGDFTVINGHMVEDPMHTLQQLRLKASSRAFPSTMPTMKPTLRVTPTVTNNPTSPPEERPTSHNGVTGEGHASTTPMDTGAHANDAAEDNGDATMRAQSRQVRRVTVSSVTIGRGKLLSVQ